MNHRFASLLRLCLLIVILAAAAFQPQHPAHAAASLSVTPITWNIIGLDSNNVNVGPNHFPVGARVCNTGDAIANNVKSSFVWDSNDPYIDLRAGTLTAYTSDGTNLNPGACTDFYYEVEITRNSAAYNHTRRYHIAVTADGGLTGSTPTPREIFVEHLVSQSRNAVTDVQLDGVSIAPGGTMTMMVGQTYTIQLTGYTATQGYEQIEYFINFPNTIFQILSATSTFTADTSATVSSPNDKLYGDNCVWENDPNSPNYRACNSIGKTGGNITVTYQVKILQAPSAPLVNPEPLSTLIYDFSGSSYHYNSDYGVSTRYAYILDPSAITIAKNFNPDPTNVSGISTLTFTLTNPTPVTVTGLNFTDTLPALPGAMTIANPTNASTSGCGTPTFAPVAGAGSLSFSNGTLAPNSSCTIKVNVTVPVAGTYNNTSSNLFIDTLDTGNNASDSLTVNNAPPAPAPVCGLSLASWDFPSGFSLTSPVPTTSSVTASASPGAGITSMDSSQNNSGSTHSWGSNGAIATGATLDTANNDYFEFPIDTTGVSSVELSFAVRRTNNGPLSLAIYYGTSSTPPGTLAYNMPGFLSSQNTWYPSSDFGTLTFNSGLNVSGTTYFRIYAFNASNSVPGSDLYLDDVTFTGCAVPNPPAITKTFSPDPIAVNGTSTLTFTLSNSNSIALTGVTFTDALPTGLQVAATPTATTTCGGTPTWAPTAGATNLTFGSPTGATIPANNSCTVSINITGTAAGTYPNVSGFVSSTEGGTNTGSTGIATASLTVLKPPSIAKLFAPNPILTNGTSTLTFTITNPNLNNALTGIAFSDIYPGGVVNTTPASTTNTCGGILTAGAGVNNVSLSGGTVASGSTCTVTINVTASSVGSYTNTSDAVSSTNGGAGNTASDTLSVEAPAPAIALLKQVSTSAIGPWTSYITVDAGTSVYYQFTIENTGDVPLSPVSVADPKVSTAGCTWPASLPVAVSGNDNHIATCVVGPIAAVAGSNTNTATASGTFSGITYTSTSSSATYSTPELTLVKSVTETYFIIAGDTLNYSYLVTNSGFAPLPGPVTVTDDKAPVSCPAVTTVGDLDNYLDPGESVTCTAIHTVLATDVTANFVTNTASASAAGVTSNTDTETVNRLIADLTVIKSNNVSGSVSQNGTFNWTITVNNTGIGDASFADTNVIMNDTLPGVAAYYPQGALTVTNGGTPPTGTINCSITGIALVCVANGGLVTLPAGSSFSVTFAVTPTSPGSLTNTATVDPSENVVEGDETNNTGSDTVTVVAPPSITKSFLPDPIALNGTSTLTFTTTNPNSVTPLTGVAFTDNLPGGLQVAGTPNATATGCGTPTFVPAAGDTTLTFTGGTNVASGICTVTVDITAITPGTITNISGAVTSTNGGTGNTASATLNVIGAVKTIVSTSESSTGFVSGFERVAIGEVIRYRLTTDLPEGTWANVQITDAIDTGIQFLNDGTAAVSYTCDGSCTNSTFMITPATFSSSTDPTFDLGTVVNPDSDANTEYVTVEFNVLVLNMASNLAGGATRNNNFTFSINGLTITSPSVGVRVVEPSITNFTKNVSPGAGPYYPGETVTYTLTYSNGATGVGRAAAFDVNVTDALSSNLDLQSVSVTAPAGSTVTDTSTLGVGGVVRVLVNQVAPAVDISSGPTGVTINLVAQIVNSAPGGALSNTADLTYTSLPGGVTTGDTSGTCPNVTGSCTPGTSGATTGERNGTGGSPNTYTDSSTIGITVTPSADLNVTKTDGSVTYTPGGTVTYTVTVTNNGLSAVIGATVGDIRPTQIITWAWVCTAQSGGASGCDAAASSSIDFSDVVNLPSGGSIVYTVTSEIDAAATGDLINIATVTAPAGVTDPLPANNSSTDTNTFAGIPALTIAKTETSTGPYAVGDSINYSIVVTNTGSTTLTNVVVSDPQLSPNSANCASVVLNGTCTLNGSYVVTQVDVDAGSFVNTASVTDDDVCPAAGTGTCEDSVTVNFIQNPAITIVKSSDATGTNAIGDMLTYTYDVENTGNVTLTNVTVTDVHAGLSAIICAPAQGSSLLPGNTIQCTATYLVTQADVDAGRIDNVGVVTGTPPAGPNVTGNDSLSEPITQNPAINMAKTPTLQNVLSGGTANFILTVTNSGNVTLTGVSVTDAQCTTGPTFVSGDTNNDNQLQIAETWTYSCSTSNVNADFTNSADVNCTPPTGPNVTDNVTANVAVTVPQADLSLTKTVDNSTPLVATNIVFTLTVTNASPDPATGVTVTDVIPNGFTYVSDDGGGAYNNATGLWTVGNLNVNASATLKITVAVNISGSYTNYAQITASNLVDPDSTPGNGPQFPDEDDDDSVIVTPTQNNPTGLTKTVSASNQAFTTNPDVAIGEIVTYQVNVNVPPGVFTNAQLVDTMDRGLSYMDCVGITANGLTTSVAGSFASICSTPTTDDAGGGTTVDVGRRVTFGFGTLTNNTNSDQTLIITYRAVVLDNAANVSGVNLRNSAQWTWGGAGNLGPASTTLVVAEPDLSISKTSNASLVAVGSEITINLTIQHTGDSETNAFDAQVTDVLPAELELTAGTLDCTTGAQDADTCNYNSGTRTVSAAWNNFALGGGNGRVTFRVRVLTLQSNGISNVGNVFWTSLPDDVSLPQNSNVFSTERDYDPASQVDVYGASDTLVLGVFNSVPATGFAPNVVTDLSNTPRQVYSGTGGITVEIPSLGINIPIVGVPLKNGEWNVSWLGNQAGWLEGSAFPSYNGNSVLTSHVYLSNGLPGPFVNLNQLKFGDRIIVHAYGQKYVFEVRTNTVVGPNDISIFKHEEKPWLTLVTCKEYDEKTNTYKKRAVVRAVLVMVEWE